ncbi:unnamed protein product [Brassica napus]|uniref:(rape) hypothetical protein n=1 Tax=Brassica napus TaxID=3708 RepID=A0A816PBI1_BRANA|nr:unnamed protein product [Brassica napus]
MKLVWLKTSEMESEGRLSTFIFNTMAISPSKPQTSSRSFTRALALAFNEWLLIPMLFVNSIFSHVITRFADHSELQSPCLMCSQQQIT